MEGMEDKLGAILGNPAMMQQIMNMAQAFGQQTPPPPKEETSPLPDLDPAILTKVMHLAGKTRIDPNQQALLQALKPYLTPQRVEKLKKAMGAAKLAGIATSFLGNPSNADR